MTNFPNEYAKALYEIAEESNSEDVFLKEMDLIIGMFDENPRYIKLLDAPMIPAEDRTALVDKAFGTIINAYLLNFIKILVEKKQVRQFAKCRKVFLRLYDEARGRERVTVITATPLSEIQKGKLLEGLEKWTKRTVLPIHQVDPGCLGGVILRFANKQIDGSVKGKLEQIRKLIHSK